MPERSSDKGGSRAPTAERSGMPGPDDRTVISAMNDGEEKTPSKLQYQPPYMVIVEGPHTGSRFPLGDGANIVGRAPGNAIRLEDQSVSRQHAEIMKGTSGWVVRDLGSKNGTLVNAKPISDAVIIGHKDVIKTGIYQLRLITQATGAEEEMALPPEIAMADRTVFVAASPDGLTAEVLEREAEEPGLPEDLPQAGEGAPLSEEELSEARVAKGRQLVMVVALVLVAAAALGYFANRFFFKSRSKVDTAPPAVTSLEGQSIEALGDGGSAPPVLPTPPIAEPPAEGLPQPPETSQATPATPAAPIAPAVPAVPVFLDFASSPMPARVTFQDKEIGQAPVRVNVELAPDKEYHVQALFTMPEIQQQFAQDIPFTVVKDKAVIPILFRAPIGMLKVMSLPRDVQFYLEGKFSHDKFQEQTAKLQEIVLQKPIYIPFGIYSIELRRTKQLGESSTTFVPDIIFKRDFTIAEDTPTYLIEVRDEDLKVFPAKVKSDPQNADVFVDGKMVGRTPYDGIFPLGEHKLTLRKEGYFEHSEDLKVDINMPYIADVKLKTSVAGAHINNARLAMNRALYQDAINELAQALGSSPAEIEVALANYLLGECYLKMGDVGRAIGYYNQAKENEAQRYPAMLGLASAYATLQKVDQALPLLVEVLLKSKEENIKKEAHSLFQKMSPFRSVMYIYSDPPGARVTVNEKPVAQQTPVILHELSLGNYRIRIEKAGFLPTDLNLSLSVNEFNPVIVKLKAIPQ